MCRHWCRLSFLIKKKQNKTTLYQHKIIVQQFNGTALLYELRKHPIKSFTNCHNNFCWHAHLFSSPNKSARWLPQDRAGISQAVIQHSFIPAPRCSPHLSSGWGWGWRCHFTPAQMGAVCAARRWCETADEMFFASLSDLFQCSSPSGETLQGRKQPCNVSFCRGFWALF